MILGRAKCNFDSETSLSPVTERTCCRISCSQDSSESGISVSGEIGIYQCPCVYFLAAFPFGHRIQANRTVSWLRLQKQTLIADETTRVLHLRTGYVSFELGASDLELESMANG